MSTLDKRNRVALENDGSRVDARAKVTGAAKYTFDITHDGMIIARHIRSPFAEGKLVKADLAAARAVKGVLEVALYSDARDANADVQTDAVDQVRKGDYGGQPVGHVCAETPQQAEDAIAALKMEWEHGTPRVDLAREAGPFPALSPDDAAKFDAVCAGAAKVVEATYETQVQHHVSLETHGAVVKIDGGKAIVHGSTQGTSSFRDGLEKDLGIDKKDIEVHCEFIGGGFGSKFGPGIEGKLAAQMAKKFSRPCKVMNNRKDESRDTGLRPGSLQYYKVALDAAGKILATRHHGFSSVGTRKGGGGIRVTKYDVGTMSQKLTEVNLSSCAPRPQRAPGCPQGAFAIEGVMDECAAAVGMDPIAFRKVNDKRAKDSGEPIWGRMLDVAAKEIGWERRKPDGTWAGTKKRGFGCGVAEWENGMFAPCGAEARVFRDGKMEIRSGIQDIGVGNRTMLVDLFASRLGVDRKLVTGLCGSTEFPIGPASGGSMVARSIAPAVFATADQTRMELMNIASAEVGVPAAELGLKDGNIVVSATGEKKLSWADLCKKLPQDFISIVGKSDKSLQGKGDSDGCCLAEVEVDTETGIVKIIKIVNAQQCGLPVNRKLVESQIIGGTIQGISYAMFEDRILNVENGAPVNPNMEWYKIAGPVDIPEIVPILDVPDGFDGVRSLGEPPIIGVPGAIANAVANAIGARVRSLPITPAKVLAAMKAKGGVA